MRVIVNLNRTPLWAGAESLNPNRRLPDENLVSLVQWLGPHRTAKRTWQAQPDHRPRRRERESHIPEWLLTAQKSKRSLIGVQVNVDWWLAVTR